MPYLNSFPGALEAHDFFPVYRDDEITWRCRRCLCKWKRKPNYGKCAGVPVYDDWDAVPRKLVSATAMYRDHKRKLPDDALPVAAKRSEVANFTPLYLIEQGDPNYKGKRKSTKPAPLPPQETKTVQKEFNPFGWLDEVRSDE